MIVSGGYQRDMDLWQLAENTLFLVNSEKQSFSTLVGGGQVGMGGRGERMRGVEREESAEGLNRLFS